MKTLVSTLPVGLLLVAAAALAGCSSAPESDSAAGDGADAADGTKYLLSSEPEGAQTVVEARESAEDDEEVVVVGRIGGSTNPWIKDRAAFSIVDPSLKACNENPDDACKFPWDYCCESSETLAASTALVKVVDEKGNVVKGDAQKLLGLKELKTVVVRGKAQRDEAGNLTVLATGVYVKS